MTSITVQYSLQQGILLMTLLFTIDYSNRGNCNPLRKLNTNLKSWDQWLLGNNISLNTTKTELISFRNKSRSKATGKIRLNCIKLIETDRLKYV